MKKAYLVIFLLLLGAAGNVRASHFLGGDLRYEYTGNGNTYRVYLTLYKSCETATASLGVAETIQFSSVGCGQGFSRTIQATSMDTLHQIYCPATSTQTSCQLPNAIYPGFVVGTYSDTVSLSPCTDWKMVWTNCCRSGGILNILNPASAAVWVEAFLDNSTAINTSAWVPNPPPFLMGTIGTNTFPANGIDAEGDSLHYELVNPLGAGGLALTYNVGYSLALPLGTTGSASVNNTNQTIQLQCANGGKYALAMKISEYRNGQLVGYTMRDWYTTVLNGNHLNPPMLTGPVSNLHVVTCPGQSHTINLSFSNGVPTDSIYVSFTPPSNGITFTTSYSPGLGSGSGTISWTTPATLNPATMPQFYIKIFTRNNACTRSYAYYGIVVRTAQCATDTVWAGDANDDYTVNMYDPLAIAIAYGNTGPARTAPTITWVPQVCANWSLSFLNNVNRKHADCDGNGTVNNTDLGAVTANYALTHPKGSFQQVAKVTGVPDLYFDHTGINAIPGASVSMPIKLGSSASMMNNVYGLAATVKISGITPGAAAISYPVSWLGTAANTVRFSKATSSNAIDWAYARNDHQNTSGQGALSYLDFTIPAGTPVGQKVILTFENVKMIDVTGAEIHAFNNLSDTITVKPTGVAQIATLVSAAVIVPNPSRQNSVLQLYLQQNTAFTVTVTDVAGKTVWHTDATPRSGAQLIALPADILQAGIYMVRIGGNGWQYPEVLKWVKE